MPPDQAQNTADSEPVVLTCWAFKRLGDVLVLCSTGKQPPPHADFEVWMQQLARVDFDKLIIYSDGGSPSATQRSRITTYLKNSGRTIHVALMTDSVIARGLLTAIEWVVNSGTMKPFPLTELNAALAWLQIEHAHPRIAAAVAKLRALLHAKMRVAG
jgi:hypothetical protein